jgi:hypothetical protein
MLNFEIPDLESNTFEAAQGNTLVLLLGEREWSNIPNEISIDTLFSDDSWRHSYRMRLRSAKLALGQITEETKKRSLKKISLLAGIAIGVALILNLVTTKFLSKAETKNHKDVSAISNQIMQKNATSKNQTIALKKVDQLSESTRSQLLISKIITDEISIKNGSNQNGSLVANEAETRTFPSNIEMLSDRSLDTAEKTRPGIKDLSKIIKQNSETGILKNSLKNLQRPKSVEEKLPVPALEKPLTRDFPLPPIPGSFDKKINSPQVPTVAIGKTVAVVAPEKPMLEVDETGIEPSVPREATTVNSNVEKRKDVNEIEKTSEKTPGVEKMEKKQILVNRGDLPNYKILAVTKNSVVISNPINKMPKQILVGNAMPSGEILKSVDEGAGVATTDARVLKMK